MVARPVKSGVSWPCTARAFVWVAGLEALGCSCGGESVVDIHKRVVRPSRTRHLEKNYIYFLKRVLR